MSITSHLESAEESIRQALINALAEGEEFYLTELFQAYQVVKDLSKKQANSIRFTDNRDTYYNRNSEFNFNLSSDYLDRPGGDLDAMDDIISFGGDTMIPAAGPVHVPGGMGNDVISFGDYKSRDD